MARRFICGGETGDMSPWDYSKDFNVVAARTGMTSPYCLDGRVDAQGSVAMKDLGANLTDFYCYMTIRREAGTTYDCGILYLFASDRTEAFYLHLDTTNYYIQCNTKWGGTTFANSSPTVFAVNTTYRLEFWFKPSTGSDGRCVVKLNGTTVIDYTGVTSEKTNVRWLGLGNCRQQAYCGALFYYDDIIIDDANWITGVGEQPHKISGLFPSANGAEGGMDVAAPPNIDADVARWLFESGDLGNDEKGGIDLTPYNTPAADTGDKKQGTSSVHLVRTSSQYFKALDADLPSGFPLKSGETNRVFTLCFWFKADAIPGSGVYYAIYNKSIDTSNYGFAAYLTNSKFRMLWATSASAITTWDVFTPTADKWYFAACKIHGDNKTWSVRLWDEDAGTWTTYTGSAPSAILRISTADLYVGAYDNTKNYFDGWLDNMRVYPLILDDVVIDLIRQNRTTFEKYEAVRIVPPNDSCVLYGHTDDAVQTFGMTDLVGSVESVKTLQLAVRHFLKGAPSVNKVTPVVRIGGTNYLGSTVQTPAWLRPESNVKLWETNPATSSAWIKDDIDGLECGLKLTDT